MSSVRAAGLVEVPAPVVRVPALMRRAVGVTLITALALVLVANLAQLAADPTAIFGSDWWWYGDGPARLLSGEPLYDPRFLAGPYVQLEPALLYTWNQAPTLVAPVAVFALIVPDAMELLTWSALMIVCVVAAFVVVWPRGLSIAASILLGLVIAILPPPLWGVWWANASCVVALGTGLVIVGERRRDDRLVICGLLMAGAAKIIPAAPLALWFLLRTRRPRPLVIAGLAAAALVVPVVLAQGPSVLTDFVTATRNASQAGSGSNVAPSGFLSLILGRQAALVVCWVAAIGLGALALRRRADLGTLLILIVASDLVIPNLWIHWLLAPMVVLVAMLGRGILRRLDLVAGASLGSGHRDPDRVPAGGA